MYGYLGEVRLFGGTFAPRGWAFCHGGYLDIAEFSALFALIGCEYGGDCRTVFALPDTRGRVVVGQGQGPGLPYDFTVGEYGGYEKITLALDQLARHTHPVTTDVEAEITPLATSDTGSSDDPENNIFAITDAGVRTYAATPDNTMAINTVTVSAAAVANATGGGQSHDNVMPVSALQYIICIEGDFPSRA